MRLDNPLLVRWEYASEERLATRNAILRELIEGGDPEEAAFAAVAEAQPRKLLEVGCGTGEFAQRAARELGAEVTAIDISERMVELTRALGIDARVADVQALPFAAGEFDCVAANWVLYHAPDVEQAIAECARVLRPGGRLVAATLDPDNLRDVWELVGNAERTPLSFDSRNGAEQLRGYFANVEQRDVKGALVFDSPQKMREFVASTIDRSHLAPHVPDFEGRFRAATHHTVFVAEKTD